MSKRNTKRVLAIVLAFTMMWGMCISASAATYGSASTFEEAIEEFNTWNEKGTLICTVADLSDIEDINTLPAGNWIDWDDEALWDAAYEANMAYGDHEGECVIDGVWTEECSALYTAWADAVNAYDAIVKVSDGSKYVAPDGPCGDVVVSESKADDKDDDDDDDDEVVIVKTVENDMGTFMDVSKNDITTALNSLNQAIAAGDTQAAQNIRVTGVTVDTGVWHSFNVGVYEQIENAGIPVTLKFTYAGVRYSVTIPAGAKVTDLCDENGWCGFLNLAAHYGFEVL